MSTGQATVEVQSAPERVDVDVEAEPGLVRARVGADGVSTALFLSPEEAKALGEELADAADRAE